MISKYNFETIQLGLNVIIPLIKQNSLFQIVYFKVRLFAKKRFPRSLTDQPFFSISNAYKNRTEKDLKKPRALLQSGDHFWPENILIFEFWAPVEKKDADKGHARNKGHNSSNLGGPCPARGSVKGKNVKK